MKHEHKRNDKYGHDSQENHGHSINPIAQWIKDTFVSHKHSQQEAALDEALATQRGIQTLKISLIALLVTASFQVVIVLISGSVALLSDTIHNLSDALTALPLGLAFWLSRRSRNQRYTYGFGRAEDIAGTIIVLMILFSAVEAVYQSMLKIINPQPIQNVGWVAAAAIIGFFGNELVALLRIRVGKEIGSAALVADGYHARTDGFTSLAVLGGAIGVWLGYPLLDPAVGLVIGIVILGIVFRSAREIWFRIMDAVDPAITGLIESTAAKAEGVMDVHDVAVRWVGHRQRAEFHIIVDCQMPTCKSHSITENVRHELFHLLPALVEVTVHVDPCECERCEDVHPTAHHIVPAGASW